MPSATNVVINDGTSDRTYKPVGSVVGTPTSFDFLFKDVTTAQTLSGQSTLRYSYRPTSGDSAAKTRVKLDVPQELTSLDTGEVYVDGVNRVDINIIISPKATLAQRTALAEMAASAIAHSLTQGYVISGDVAN
jgi:hypothetical protein